VDHYAVEIWNSVVKKHAGRNLTVLANAKCKLIYDYIVTCSNISNHDNMYDIVVSWCTLL